MLATRLIEILRVNIPHVQHFKSLIDPKVSFTDSKVPGNTRVVARIQPFGNRYGMKVEWWRFLRENPPQRRRDTEEEHAQQDQYLPNSLCLCGSVAHCQKNSLNPSRK